MKKKEKRKKGEKKIKIKENAAMIGENFDKKKEEEEVEDKDELVF